MWRCGVAHFFVDSVNKSPNVAHILHDMREYADRDLVERSTRGDGAAIGELFSRYWRAARGAAFGVTGDFASAEDAAAEAFRHALEALASLRDPDRFGPWLRTIVIRKARLSLRSRRQSVEGLIADQPDSSELACDALERLELAALLQQSVRELPARLREAVSLFYFEGYDTDDAARFLDIPSGTFRRRLHEGRRELRSVAEQILRGSKPVNEERERQIERLKHLIDNAGDTDAFYKALRESMALRPPPKELMGSIIRRRTESAPGANEGFIGRVRETARQFTGPSARALDSGHPVGSVALAIRQALPDFQNWPLDVGDAAAHFFTFIGDERERMKALLPPGFSEGRPGAFLRATRGFLRSTENGGAQTTYQLVQESPDMQTFRAGMNGVQVSDVIDLTWMAAGTLELRSVQELLERLSAAVLPRTSIRFLNYDEPRYRSALQLQLGGVSSPAANGGVLAKWAGHPEGVEAAHVRLFLEVWATVRSGQVIRCVPLESRVME